MRAKRILVLFLAFSLLLGSVTMAAGNLLRAGVPAVVYDGATGELTLENVQDATDLFPNFKNIMPGDELTQEITLVTKNLTQAVAIYLTSTPDEASKNALDPLTVSVSRDGEEMGEFAHNIRESVPLGVFRADGTTTLHVTLKVPTTVGNELQEARAALHWELTAYPTEAITITPASISSYVGGISSNDSGAPTLRFQVQLPNGVIWDNEHPITMTLHQEGQEPITMTPRKVHGSDSYYCFPTLERGLEFVDGNQFLRGDYLTLEDTFDSGNRGGRYVVGLVNDPAWYITAVGQNGRIYTVQVLPGDAKVYVRYVSSDAEMVDAPSSALTKVVSDEAKVNTIVDAGNGVIYRKAVAVIDENAVYYTNGKALGLGSFTLKDGQEGDIGGLKPLVALLFDDTVSLSDDLTDKHIEAKMIEHAGHAKSYGSAASYSFDGWDYNFRYLDLVNYNDGNAWVSTEADTTIYWPYPIQALNDPDGYSSYDYQILHFQGVSRSFAHKAIEDIEQWDEQILHGSGGPVKVNSEELTLTPRGIRFTLEPLPGSEDNFSPFVLMWRKKGTSTPPSGGGDSGDDDNDEPTASPAVSPSTSPAVSPSASPSATPAAASAEPTPGSSGAPSPSAAPGETGAPMPSPPATPEASSTPGVTSSVPTEPSADPSAPPPSAGPEGPGPSASAGSPQGPTLPQTGQVWWPVFLMAAAGLVLLFLGLNMDKKGKHEA